MEKILKLNYVDVVKMVAIPKTIELTNNQLIDMGEALNFYSKELLLLAQTKETVVDKARFKIQSNTELDITRKLIDIVDGKAKMTYSYLKVSAEALEYYSDFINNERAEELRNLSNYIKNEINYCANCSSWKKASREEDGTGADALTTLLNRVY